MEILDLGFDDHINYIFFNELKKEYPQINEKTSVTIHHSERIIIYREDLPEVKTPVYTDCKKGFKNYVKRSYGALIGSDRIVKDTMNFKMPEPPIEKELIMIEHWCHDYENRYFLLCVYEPEQDILYYKMRMTAPLKQ